jgi:hypothetical protein
MATFLDKLRTGVSGIWVKDNASPKAQNRFWVNLGKFCQKVHSITTKNISSFFMFLPGVLLFVHNGQ